jgi:hypothetical protein
VYGLWWFLVVSLILLPNIPAWAKRSVTVEQALILRLEMNRHAAVTYPEHIIHVAVGLSKENLEYNNVGPHLFVLAKHPEAAGTMYVVGESGQLYMLTFKMASPPDDMVAVTRPTPTATIKPVPFSPVSLLRALRDPRLPLPGSEPVPVPLPLSPDPRLTVMEASSLRVGEYVGMTLTVRSAHPQPLTLDPRIGVTVPPSAEVLPLGVLIWPPPYHPSYVLMEGERLEPGMETRVYVILEKRSAHVLR